MKSYLSNVDKLPIERSLTDLSLVKRSSIKVRLLIKLFLFICLKNQYLMVGFLFCE